MLRGGALSEARGPLAAEEETVAAGAVLLLNEGSAATESSRTVCAPASNVSLVGVASGEDKGELTADLTVGVSCSCMSATSLLDDEPVSTLSDESEGGPVEAGTGGATGDLVDEGEVAPVSEFEDDESRDISMLE